MLQKIQQAFREPEKAYNFAVQKIRTVNRFATKKIRTLFLTDFHYLFLREPKTKSRITHDPFIQNEIKKKLEENGFTIIDFEIEVDDYKRYISNAEYHNFPNYGRGKVKNFAEKSLEHYLAAKLLDLSNNDLYIDIASASSPAPAIYHKLYGCDVYRQDMRFPQGLHGKTIGGDAGNLPIADGFATKMALHCSFEHFEQDSDIKFIKEASRVLRKGGKVCILPLYLFNRYAIVTDPYVLPIGSIRHVPFEIDAVLHCHKDWDNRHARFYDVAHFISRIRDNLNRLKLTIYFVQNEKQVDVSCYVKFIALFEKE